MNPRATSDRTVRLKQPEVEDLLNRLGIHFTASGRIRGSLQFASLRAPCNLGIYYLANGAELPSAVSKSLILCTVENPDRNDGNARVFTANPKLAFYKLMRAACSPKPGPGIVHPSAVISPEATVAPDATIGPYCVIEANVRIGARCILDAHVVVKNGSEIEEDTHIEPHCTIGATGVAWVWDSDGKTRVVQPQTGGVRVGRNVFIGSDVAIVRGSVNEHTIIGDGCVIAHGSKIGHGCRLGRQVHLANNISLAGNVDVGDRAFFGSGSVVRPRTRIADAVVVGAGAVVTHDIATPDVVVSGVPARIMPPRNRSLSGVPDKPA